MTLKDELENARREIKTDSYPISIRELSSLYKDGELDLHPEFQRFLRWTPEQKTKLIESILLGIPIPSVFVFQRDDGVLDVIDGLQRISTILQFMGELENEDGGKLQMLTLGKAQYLPSLYGKMWKSEVEDCSIGDDIQKFFRQEKLDVKILLRDSDQNTKYELFQRINTGGTPLSDQEVRNCILIMIDRNAYIWLEERAQTESFKICCPVPDRLMLERYDLELVLRFALLHNISLKDVPEITDLGQFLTTQMRTRLTIWLEKLDGYASIFERTFNALDEACGDNALRRYDHQRSRFSGPFLISAFEMIALGVSANIEFVEKNGRDWLLNKVCGIWADPRSTGIYGQGVSTARRLPRTLALGRDFFSEA